MKLAKVKKLTWNLYLKKQKTRLRENGAKQGNKTAKGGGKKR
jgi:hypothetical protein